MLLFLDTCVTRAPQAHFPSSWRFCSHQKLIAISLFSFLGFLLSSIPELHSRPADLLWYESVCICSRDVCMRVCMRQTPNRYQQFVVSFSSWGHVARAGFELLQSLELFCQAQLLTFLFLRESLFSLLFCCGMPSRNGTFWLLEWNVFCWCHPGWMLGSDSS